MVGGDVAQVTLPDHVRLRSSSSRKRDERQSQCERSSSSSRKRDERQSQCERAERRLRTS